MASNTSNSTPTYYSPTAILTDSQKAPTTFTLAVPTLTPLNNGSAIEEGTKLDLPLWLAEMLAVSKPAGPASPTSLASLDMPFALGPRVLNALKADPKSVDVRAQAPWFYGLGERMLELFEDEEVGEVLLEVCLSFPHSISLSFEFSFLFFYLPFSLFRHSCIRNQSSGFKQHPLIISLFNSDLQTTSLRNRR